jgi:hypothetical protein
MKVILWLLKQLSIPNMPSYNKLQKMEKKVLDAVGDLKPLSKVSQLGNNFSILDPRKTIALVSRSCRLLYNLCSSLIMQDLAHPVIAGSMALYPEIEAEHISEVWEALRWKEFDHLLLNPMWTSDSFKQFYVDEVAQLASGAFVMPLMWVTKEGVVHAECYDLTVMAVWLCCQDHFVI